MQPEQSPRTFVMGLLNGAWIAQAVSTVTRLQVPDLLAKHGPSSARDLVSVHGVVAVPELLERLMRTCAAIGLFTEDARGRFGPTERSSVLTLDSAGSVKHFAELYGSEWWGSWGRLHEVVTSGQPEPVRWMTGDPAQLARFGEAMRSRVVSLRPLLAQCDLPGARNLVDVGGGFGHVSIELLGRHPDLHACVVDLPEVVELAEQRASRDCAAEIRSRLNFAAGDMFEDLPAGDVYLLSGILHDWDDASCVRILGRCADRLNESGRLVCIDAVLPPLGDATETQLKLMDLHMMVSLPGKERTESEWRGLLRSAGLELTRILHPQPRRGASLLEAVRAR
jgi:precorrin-6B methylase 2